MKMESSQDGLDSVLRGYHEVNTDDVFRLQSFIPLFAISYYRKGINLFLLVNHNHNPNISLNTI